MSWGVLFLTCWKVHPHLYFPNEYMTLLFLKIASKNLIFEHSLIWNQISTFTSWYYFHQKVCPFSMDSELSTALSNVIYLQNLLIYVHLKSCSETCYKFKFWLHFGYPSQSKIDFGKIFWFIYSKLYGFNLLLSSKKHFTEKKI